jgi:hypothetical protein
MTGPLRFVHSLVAATFAALIVAACADAPTAVPARSLDPPLAAHVAGPHAQPVRLQFTKCMVDPVNGIWQGEVTGDIAGDLQTELRELRVTGAVWQVRFDWIIDAGAQSFVADLSGVLNLNTGRVVMNGTVASGYLEGARVHEEGQLVDPENSCFAGDIRIMPDAS